MTYGVHVFDENGQLIMNTNSFTYQVLWQGVLDFSTSASSQTVIIPGFNPATCVFMMIPTRVQDVQSSEADGSGNQKSYPYVTTAAGQVVVTPYNPSSTTGSTASRVIAKGYAVRFA
ncbi:hypothetical protein [Pseudomonas fitomaticsae]|uniref:Uncharacterized protein n=1 Tax=Pseudomonas fitomaticsae TaxID=2837969 RepID=A0ABY3Q9K2_9PSED|nr:hypothetical protein [Pseudomonas fitomaticsae]UFQ02269.1 hypothetical protein KJY40_11465 [Pseudomonas fitomaticsae]